MSLLNDQFFSILDMDKDFAFKLAGILESSTVKLLNELVENIKENNGQKSKDILHTIKGSAANFGAEKLMEKSREVESVIHLLNTDNTKEYLEQVDEIEQIFQLTLQELEEHR